MTSIAYSEVETGLVCYDPEGRLFPNLAMKLDSGLTAQDVLLILKWKLGRIKRSNAATVAPSNLLKINHAVSLARQPERMCEGIEELMRVEGIGLATATAILTACYPDQFSVIDWRVLEVLGLFPATTDKWTVEDYVERFLPEVRGFADRHRLRLRDADRALWGISVYRQIGRMVTEPHSADKAT